MQFATKSNPHFHSIFIDGVYYENDRKWKFFETRFPTDDDIATLALRINRRITRYLKNKGLWDEGPASSENDVLLKLGAASIQNFIATGERQGKMVRRVGVGQADEDTFVSGRRCAMSDGFSLHANVRIATRARKKLQKLFRYTGRAAVALERMSETEDGKILYRLKTSYTDGTTHILFSPLEIVEKVVALIAPARAHLLRYSGILGPHSKIRKEIVPATKKPKSLFVVGSGSSWSQLLKHSFAIDVMKCPNCGGRMKLIASIKERAVICLILNHLGLPSELPRFHPPRAPPQSAWTDFYQLPQSDDEFF